jgi:hypothetical protein
MDAERIVFHLPQRFAALMAVYGLDRRVQQQGLYAHAQNDLDLDLAMMVQGCTNPVLPFEVANALVDIYQYPVDLLDIPAASGLKQAQIGAQGNVGGLKTNVPVCLRRPCSSH